MKLIERAIALVVLTLLITVSAAYAQTDRQTLVNIPFSFSVGEKAMPAGEYLIRRNRKDSDVVWVIQNKASGEAALLLTRSTHSTDTQEKAKFVFRQYADAYFLSEFWAAGTNTGREIQITDKERALAKSLAVAPQVHVLIDRGGR